MIRAIIRSSMSYGPPEEVEAILWYRQKEFSAAEKIVSSAICLVSYVRRHFCVTTHSRAFSELNLDPFCKIPWMETEGSNSQASFSSFALIIFKKSGRHALLYGWDDLWQSLSL